MVNENFEKLDVDVGYDKKVKTIWSKRIVMMKNQCWENAQNVERPLKS